MARFFLLLTLAALPLSLAQSQEIVLKGTDSPKLYSNTYKFSFTSAAARKAIDGHTHRGSSGANNEYLNCASTEIGKYVRDLQYLRVTLQHVNFIAAVRLHLRDGRFRQIWQNGLTVWVSNKSEIDFTSAYQCGNSYNAKRDGKSPLFICLKSGAYIWAILRNSSQPLQVCEVQAFRDLTKMDLTGPGVASTFSTTKPLSAWVTTSGGNAVDGKSNIGQSGTGKDTNCAVTRAVRNGREQVTFLRLSLGHGQLIYYIRLHLRDQYRTSQTGLIVGIGNSTIVTDERQQCGSAYNSPDVQSPVFNCDGVGAYVWVIAKRWPGVQVCEVEVYADIKCQQPSNPSNGAYRATNLSYEGSLSLHCDKGFKATTTTVPVTCERSGNWSRSLPTCQKSECHAPSTIKNGVLKLSGLVLGSTATYTCKPGFKFSEHSKSTVNLTCVALNNEDGLSWDDTVPDCILDDQYCKYKELENGESDTATDESGVITSVTYSCNSGYTLQGNEVLECVGGSMNGDVPRCNAVQCGPPPKPDNGNFTGNVFAFGKTVKYQCSLGHRLSTGSNAAVCQANGQWNITSAPSCRPYCSHPGAPLNGKLKLSSSDNKYIDVGSTVSYVCNNGFYISDGSNGTRVCQTSRRLSGTAPLCSRVSCKALRSPVNGSVTLLNKTLTYESRVEFKCNEGHYLQGEKIARCLATKQWSADVPSCIPYCEHPGEVSNGSLYWRSNKTIKFFVGTLLKYRCNDGYELYNKANSPRKCQEDRQWSGNKPSCRPVDCKNPKQPENGKFVLNGDATTYRSRVTFSCHQGYYSRAKKTGQCQANGNWSTESPRCKPHCDPPSDVENGVIEGIADLDYIDVDVTATYVCRKGHELSKVGDKVRTCQRNRQWSGTAPSCKPVDCKNPKQPENGKFVLNDRATTYRSTVTFSCHQGYYSRAKKTGRCQANGAWSTESPRCKPHCDPPRKVENGTIEGIDDLDYIDVNVTVTYVCKLGHELSRLGNKKRTCQRNRQWSGTEPSCKPVDCGNPKTPVNGGLRGSTTFNMAIRFFCKNGYFLQGSQSATCRADKSWSAIPPRCIPHCIKPSDPTNGRVILPRHTDPRRILTKTDITYNCNDGYIWVGATNVISCSGSLTWSHNLPTCQKGDCGTTLDPANGDCTVTHTYIRGVRTCRCVRGFKLDKPSLLTSECVIKNNVAKWNKARPNCDRIICPDLRGTANRGVILKVTGNYLDDTASYECIPGYRYKSGHMKRICTRDDIWTGLPLECEIKTCPELETPRFGTLSEHNLTFESTVSYSCKEGYKLQYGPKQRTCMFHGQWSGTAPVCQHVCTSDKCRSGAIEGKVTKASGNCVETCVERSKCPSDFSPVCGTNGKTYNNKCLLKVASCEDNDHDLEVAAQGQCRFGGICNDPQPAAPSGVSCRALFYRYWHNADSASCEQYSYGGCFEGKNSFYTIEDCQQTCIETDVCRLPFEAGKCNFKQETRFFFNSSSERCEGFQYGGCFGNENNFKTEDACSERCCVCRSLLTRKQANRANHGVIVIKVNSLKTTRNGKVSYKVKLLEAPCKKKSTWPKALGLNDAAWLSVTEVTSTDNCLCPKLSKGVTYRVGVNFVRRSGKVWEIEIPAGRFYLKEAESCAN